LDPAALRGADGVVHLAGTSIAGLWTAAKRDAIYRSRIDGTNLLIRALAEAEIEPAPTLVCASAIGIYGDRGDEILTEDSPPGDGFLAKLCLDWEAAAAAATGHGARVVSTRFGIIQSTRAGMLKAMQLSAKSGAVARFGHGRRHQSWVALDDVVAAVTFALDNRSVSGPVNVTAPHPVTNAEYAAVLGEMLHRPVIPVPPAMLRLGLRGVADELLLQSAWVSPQRLLAEGFQFRHQDLRSALRAML
jgi:uncharacterized protein (TIGR01777 family)